MRASLSRYFLLLPLLAWLLGGCSVFHLGQKDKLRMPAQMEAEYKAKEKARHKGLTYKPAEESSSDGATKDAKAADPKKPLSYSDLSESTRRKYDKHLLIKNHLPAPTPRHTYERFAFKGTEANKESRKLRHHKKTTRNQRGGGDVGSEEKRPSQPLPVAAPQPEPEPAPTPKTE